MKINMRSKRMRRMRKSRRRRKRTNTSQLPTLQPGRRKAIGMGAKAPNRRPKKMSACVILGRPSTIKQSGTYCKGIKCKFDERKLIDKYYARVHMDRNRNVMPHRWSAIQRVDNKFHGSLENNRERPESGKTMEV